MYPPSHSRYSRYFQSWLTRPNELLGNYPGEETTHAVAWDTIAGLVWADWAFSHDLGCQIDFGTRN